MQSALPCGENYIMKLVAGGLWSSHDFHLNIHKIVQVFSIIPSVP